MSIGREKNHSTTPFSKADKRAAIELWRAKVPLKNIRSQLNVASTNMEDWKREIVKLWVMKMSDDRYLQSLVESMPRRLQEVIEREGDTTKY